jgi:hypothetical protein
VAMLNLLNECSGRCLDSHDMIGLIEIIGCTLG